MVAECTEDWNIFTLEHVSKSGKTQRTVKQQSEEINLSEEMKLSQLGEHNCCI